MKSIFIFVLFFLSRGLFFSQSIDLQLIYTSGEQTINPKSSFVIHTAKDNTKLTFPQLKDYKIPFNTEHIDVHFSLTGIFRDSIFIYSKQKIPKLTIYKISKRKLIKVGTTGFAQKILSNSVKGENNIILLPRKTSGDYILRITREKYKIGVPSLYIGNQIIEDKGSKAISNVSMLTAGFQISLFLCAIVYLLFNFRRSRSWLLLFFLLINATDILYFLSRYNIIILETKGLAFTNSQVWNILGDINILLYYIFFARFFRISKKSCLSYLLAIGILFWFVQIFVELSNFHSFFWIKFAQNYLNIASVVDAGMLISIALYVVCFRFSNYYYRIGFIGLFALCTSAVEIALPHILGNTEWQGLSHYSFKILQYCVLINIFTFTTALLYKSIISEREKRRYKTELLLKEIEKQKSLQAERDRISGDMHDELGAGISAIKLQSEILKQQIKKDSLNDDDVNELIRISDDMKTSMREILWSLNTKNDNVQAFANHCQIYIENYLSKTNIHLKADFRIIHPSKEMPSDIRRNLLLIIKEACHNTVKHSHATEMTLLFSEQENQLILTIQDNGIGFTLPQTLGYGLNMMRSRIECIGGYIQITSSSGTYIYLEVPL
ncbi:hypothetical protein EAVNVH72_01997 [Elizabethkingia anophelis]|nr:hypothetical protein EAVNVH72_01491 [Elizabethkingia anophelis]CAI9682377.1 hypothetical protein EAVNVH72_01997 [Elizabethkingia anophelis]